MEHINSNRTVLNFRGEVMITFSKELLQYNYFKVDISEDLKRAWKHLLNLKTPFCWGVFKVMVPRDKPRSSKNSSDKMHVVSAKR